ncbi:hypothetical protein EC844_11477 [Acinetobacter calcoaceticus]|uniref:Uncharacterized protein n=1 Tax=Acinetobacter calcoaceticus TaxID=471 RepID=A0A4R1XRY3_ACICA|nr:hypothetical protein EC844_11477 [Acinetobacter calcoaceticus]
MPQMITTAKNKAKLRAKIGTYGLLSLLLLCTHSGFAASHMQALSDEQMSETTGQALMSLSFTAPTDPRNLEYYRPQGDKTVGFYKLGMEAEVELNANIRKLQLGCGGINGPGGCDIDIDNLSLSGLKVDAAGNPITMSNTERASSSAVISNPFIEFAIRNPELASTREMVGLRISAEKLVGLLTVGDNNTTANGINSLSGYMKINGYGTAVTQDGVFGLRPGEVVHTVADIQMPLCLKGCGDNKPLTAGYGNDKNTGLKIPSMNAPFQVNNAIVSGTRLKSANVTAIAQIPNIPINSNSGQLGVKLETSACVLILCVQDTFIKLNTSVNNLSANIEFNEGLGYIHNLPIRSAAYLGLQSKALRWPGADEVAQPGWWLSLQDPVNLGDISPRDKVDIASVYPQFAKILGEKLAEDQYKIKVGLGDGISAIFQAGITKTISPVDLKGSSVNIGLENLILKSQDLTSNCYGGMKFC